jgi:hypothetical protein
MFSDMLHRTPARISLLVLQPILAFTLGACGSIEQYAMSRPLSETPGINVGWKGSTDVNGAFMMVAPANTILIWRSVHFLDIPIDPETIPAEKQEFNSIYYSTYIPPEKRAKYPDTHSWWSSSEYQESRKRSPSKPTFFLFEIFLSAGSDKVELRPGNIVLRQADREWHPVGMYDLAGPAEDGWLWVYRVTRTPDLPICSPKEDPSVQTKPRWRLWVNPANGAKQAVTGSIVLQAKERRCIAVEFDRPPPDPREEFHLDLRSIEIGEQKRPISLRYVPDTWTRFEGF